MENKKSRLNVEKKILLSIGIFSLFFSLFVSILGHEKTLQLIFPNWELVDKVEGSTSFFDTDSLVELLKILLKKITFFYL
jgi:flagellar biosynthesis protein FlhB